MGKSKYQKRIINKTINNPSNNNESKERSVYNSKYKLLIEVFQGEYAITNKNDKKPVLASGVLGPCVAITGWSNGVGFLIHYDSLTLVYESLESLVNDLGDNKEFEIRIIGGMDFLSDSLIYSIESIILSQELIKGRIIERDVGGVKARAVALDTRTGELFNYKPNNNPYRRTLTKDEILMNTFLPLPKKAKLIYKSIN